MHVSRSLQTWHSLNITSGFVHLRTNGNCMRNCALKASEKSRMRGKNYSTMQSPASMCWFFQTRVLDFHFLLRRAARLIVLRNRLLELFYLIGSGHLKTCAKLPLQSITTCQLVADFFPACRDVFSSSQEVRAEFFALSPAEYAGPVFSPRTKSREAAISILDQVYGGCLVPALILENQEE